MKKRWPYVIVPLGLLLALVGYLWTSPFSRLLAANYAKELCSCLFVSKLPGAHCSDYAAQYLKVSGYQIDQVGKSVQAWGWGRTSTAKWLGEKEGCRLQDIQ